MFLLIIILYLSAMLQGASVVCLMFISELTINTDTLQIYVVDRVPERLAKAKEIGCIPIDFVGLLPF